MALAWANYPFCPYPPPPELVLNHSGNSSGKPAVIGLLGETSPVLCVKGTGWLPDVNLLVGMLTHDFCCS